MSESSLFFMDWMSNNGNFHLDMASWFVAWQTTIVAMIGLISIAQCCTTANPIGRCLVFWRQLNSQEVRLSCSDSVKKGIDDYAHLHQQTNSTKISNYASLVNAYYDLATVFYEWGWCSCFHFTQRYAHESGFYEGIRRHEYVLASQLQLYGIDQHVLDVGCGIGGPMRNISAFLQCRVTGVTLNQYQVNRGNELTAANPMVADRCRSIQGDFMKLDETFVAMPQQFDGAYAIEATCHAPDRVQCYKQVYNQLKPGAIFALYEWCMTDKYDEKNQEHLRMKQDIELGNGLPDIATTRVCLQAFKDAGFELIREQDLALQPHTEPWYLPLTPNWNPLSQRFQFNWLGAPLANTAIAALELFRIAPKGTVKTQLVLQAGAFALRDAGEQGIFTTMYLMVGRKPSPARA